MSVISKIIALIQRIAAERQITLPPLEDHLSLHKTEFDFSADDRPPGAASLVY